MGALPHDGIKILETLFFVGVTGSTVVPILSAIEDIEVLAGKGESH